MPSSANTAPLNGIISANSGQISSALAITAGSLVNSRGTRSPSASRATANSAPIATDQPIIRIAAARAEGAGEQPPARDRPADHPDRGGARRVRGARAEHPADHHLAGDRDRV